MIFAKFFIFILCAFSGFYVLGQNCTVCRAFFKDRSDKEKEIERIKGILKANETLLTSKNAAGNTSVLIKINSNIFMATTKIETLKNEIEFIDIQKHKQSCEKCPR
jgi:hypothetical protein